MLRPCLTGQVASKTGGHLIITIKGRRHHAKPVKLDLKVGEKVCVQFDWGSGKITGLSRFDGDIYKIPEELVPEDEFNEPLFDVPDQELLAYRSFSGTEE